MDKSPKVYADLYIDDLNLGVPLIYPKDKNAKPYVDWNAIEKMLFDKDEFKHILDKEIKKIHFKTK